MGVCYIVSKMVFQLSFSGFPAVCSGFLVVYPVCVFVEDGVTEVSVHAKNVDEMATRP